MKSKIIKTIIMLTPIFLGLSMIFVLYFGVGRNYGATIFESEQDYKLKFVDSTDYLTLGDSTTLILPFDILSAEETEEGIIVKTQENAIVYAPLDCDVISYDTNSRELQLHVNSIKVLIKGIITGVSPGDKIACGQLVGTVDGNSCVIRVFWGKKCLSLQELKVIL